MKNEALKIALALETSARLVEAGRKDAEAHFDDAEALWAVARALHLEGAVDAYLFGWAVDSEGPLPATESPSFPSLLN